jgi:hypothetical protein
MYDPDQQSPVLRLVSIPKTPSLTTSQILAIAEREMEEAIKRWVSATVDYAAERAQAQPISAVRHPAINRIISREEFAARQSGGDGAVRF